jgi:predicted O-methyltransferase YrrM
LKSDKAPSLRKDIVLIDIQKTAQHLKRYNFRYFQHKVYDLSSLQWIESTIDCHRLELKYPGLRKKYDLLKDHYRQRILSYYHEYINRISSEIMASSLQLSIFLLFLCEMAQPKKILDLGSGFSSFIFRFYALTAKEKPIIWSVDDSEEWLIKTATFLTSHHLPATNLVTWNAISNHDIGHFDFIFYDLGPFPFRKETLRPVMEKMTDAHGFIILDDMHSADYGLFVRRLLKSMHFQYYNTGYYTKDHFKRYSLMLTY